MMNIDERLEALTLNVELLLSKQVDAEERADREMSDLRAELNRGLSTVQAELHRGIRMSIEEQRRERERRKQLDSRLAAMQAYTQTKFDELAAAQAATEIKLQRLIETLGARGA